MGKNSAIYGFAIEGFQEKDIDMLIETPYNMFRVISYLCGK